MKKHAAVGLLSALLVTSGMAQAAEGQWNFLAGMDKDYVANPTLSIMAGSLDPDISGASSDTVTGLELSLNCPLLQPPSNKIRQQVSYTRYDDQGLKISSFELNPHYVVDAMPGLGIGFGPGLGYVKAETAADSEGMFALQLGASLHYTALGKLFLGAEARYQTTQSDDFAGQKGADNFRIALKAGYNF
jgi:hypothetical protein